jgi:hypothetical protein
MEAHDPTTALCKRQQLVGAHACRRLRGEGASGRAPPVYGALHSGPAAIGATPAVGHFEDPASDTHPANRGRHRG